MDSRRVPSQRSVCGGVVRTGRCVSDPRQGSGCAGVACIRRRSLPPHLVRRPMVGGQALAAACLCLAAAGLSWVWSAGGRRFTVLPHSPTANNLLTVTITEEEQGRGRHVERVVAQCDDACMMQPPTTCTNRDCVLRVWCVCTGLQSFVRSTVTHPNTRQALDATNSWSTTAALSKSANNGTRGKKTRQYDETSKDLPLSGRLGGKEQQKAQEERRAKHQRAHL